MIVYEPTNDESYKDDMAQSLFIFGQRNNYYITILADYSSGDWSHEDIFQNPCVEWRDL